MESYSQKPTLNDSCIFVFHQTGLTINIPNSGNYLPESKSLIGVWKFKYFTKTKRIIKNPKTTHYLEGKAYAKIEDECFIEDCFDNEGNRIEGRFTEIYLKVDELENGGKI